MWSKWTRYQHTRYFSLHVGRRSLALDIFNALIIVFVTDKATKIIAVFPCDPCRRGFTRWAWHLFVRPHRTGPWIFICCHYSQEELMGHIKRKHMMVRWCQSIAFVGPHGADRSIWFWKFLTKTVEPSDNLNKNNLDNGYGNPYVELPTIQHHFFGR